MHAESISDVKISSSGQRSC